jgi:hypothetical protein
MSNPPCCCRWCAPRTVRSRAGTVLAPARCHDNWRSAGFAVGGDRSGV